MVREAEPAQGGAFRNANDTEAARATAPSPGGQSRGPRGVANGKSVARSVIAQNHPACVRREQETGMASPLAVEVAQSGLTE